MHTSTTALALAGLLGTAAAETVHGVVVFSRHGDRTTKHYGNQTLTSLGARQCFQVGGDYRARYLAADSPHRIRGISEFEYVPAQVWASAPDQGILLDTATSFLQGLYPPLGDTQPAAAAEKLANSTSVTGPLSGYQYVTLHGVVNDSPETIWIKGDDGCPALDDASATFKASPEYKARVAATRDFYRALYPLVPSFYASADNLSYAKAYDIFDVINVENIHNAASLARKVTADQLLQLRTLADSAEFGLNFNNSQPARSIHASTLAGSVLNHLNQTAVAATTPNAKAAPLFTLLAGSYDTLLAFFGLTNLTAASSDFFGLPDYASTMSFELFSAADDDASPAADDLRVRYLFRNGTAGTLRAFPLFGSGKADLPWAEFVELMGQRAITSTEAWCGVCNSDADFCAAYRDEGVDVKSGGGSGVSKGSWIAVLVVMAVAIVGNLVWAGMWLAGRRKRSGEAAVLAGPVKRVESVPSSVGKESV